MRSFLFLLLPRGTKARRLPELCRQRRPRPVPAPAPSTPSFLPLVTHRTHIGALREHKVAKPEPLERSSPPCTQSSSPLFVQSEQPAAEAEDVPGADAAALVGAGERERDAGGGVGDARRRGLDVHGDSAFHLAEGGGLAWLAELVEGGRKEEVER